MHVKCFGQYLVLDKNVLTETLRVSESMIIKVSPSHRSSSARHPFPVGKVFSHNFLRTSLCILFVCLFLFTYIFLWPHCTANGMLTP